MLYCHLFELTLPSRTPSISSRLQIALPLSAYVITSFSLFDYLMILFSFDDLC